MVTALHAWSQCYTVWSRYNSDLARQSNRYLKKLEALFVIPVEGRGHSITCLVTVLWVWSHSVSDYKPDRAVDYLKELEALLVIPVEMVSCHR